MNFNLVELGEVNLAVVFPKQNSFLIRFKLHLNVCYKYVVCIDVKYLKYLFIAFSGWSKFIYTTENEKEKEREKLLYFCKGHFPIVSF